ncbi:general odorant-binding protein 28a-like [Haematobia irritans]|uniref:general odorant-binding protein 28a-like n=1 Tax=Haematobia irritans TaxID=7368 RepID=UPI003F503E3D
MRIMKLSWGILFILWTVASATASVQIQKEWCSGLFLQNVLNRCTLAHGTTREDVYHYLQFKGAATEAAKCFRACVFNACKLYNANGAFSPDVAWRTAAITSNGDVRAFKILDQVGNYCVKQSQIGHNRCDTTESFIRCYAANSPFRVTLASLL